MLQNINWLQLFTGLISLTITLAVVYMMVNNAQVPDLLVGAFGLVVGHYLRRQSEQDAHATAEQVLRQQALVPVK
jgi:hypothetical protein